MMSSHVLCGALGSASGSANCHLSSLEGPGDGGGAPVAHEKVEIDDGQREWRGPRRRRGGALGGEQFGEMGRLLGGGAILKVSTENHSIEGHPRLIQEFQRLKFW